MAPLQHFLLAGNDREFVHSIQQHLHKTFGQSPACCDFDALRTLLATGSDQAVLLAASRPADTEAARALVREICLQRLATQILIVEADELAGPQDLTDMDAHVSARLAWPDHARGIVAWIKRRLQDSPASSPAAPTVREEIARRLVQYTPSLEPLVDSLALAAEHQVTVLIDGETGTGKTFLARLLHDCSPRRDHRFVVVPCGALASNLVESEFFGHVKGAFTGADTAKVGKFAAVGQGTLLLDEIDALGLEQQANLLRVIETGEFEPVGSNETQICTARIVVASNIDLEEAIERGQFRRDLFYRLNVMPFYLPPLRERLEDIEPLVRGMTARFNTKFNKELVSIHPDVLAALEAFPWPGNIRQLENVVQQAVLISSGTELRVEHLSPLVRDGTAERPGQAAIHSLIDHREASERAAIQRALSEAGNSRTRAAQSLGVSRVTLYKKMKKYGLSGPAPSSDWSGEAPPPLRAVIA